MESSQYGVVTGEACMPSLGGLCGVFYEYEHTANLLLATVGVSWTMFGYIATRVLERSAYTKIWTRGVILGLFLIHNIFLSVVTPFGNNFTMNKIFGTFVAVVTLSYHVKYLRSLDPHYTHAHDWYGCDRENSTIRI